MATILRMPFTISHAAAVLPLKNSRLPLAALMIGSMSPDFAYFLPFEMLTRLSTHSLRGILFFCLPVGMVVWLLFVRVLERPTIQLLPDAWRDRVPRSDPHFSLSALGFAGIAVILGAVTHIVWDAFTHASTPVTHAFPVLDMEVFSVYGHSIPMFFVLQCLSSVIGLLALAIWALRLRHSVPRAQTAEESRITLPAHARGIALVVMILSSGATALVMYASYSGLPLRHRVFELLIGAMMGWLLAWCVIAVMINRGSRFIDGGSRGRRAAGCRPDLLP